MKKTISALLSLVMVLSILLGMAVPVYADISYEIYDTALYRCRLFEDGTAEISRYKGEGAVNMIVPDSIAGHTVTKIGTQAYGYTNTKELKTVTIPGCITEIGDYAFSQCKNLERVEMLYGVKNINFRAFENCNRLREVIIPESVTSIGTQVFMGCDVLKNIVIPNSVTELGNGVFDGCVNLKSVKLSSGLTKISEGTFGGCENLTSVTGTENIKYIGRNAFLDCKILKNMFFSSALESIDYNAFGSCNNLADVYYCADTNRWNKVLIEAGNERLTQANFHFHNSDNGVITKKATCAADGIKTYTCYICNATRTETIPATAKHTYTEKVIAPTCAKNGYTLHTCTTCGVYYTSDYVHTIGHGSKTYRALVSKATFSKNGSAVAICSTCDTVVKKETIYYPKTISLSRTAYTYNGKVQTPTVTVKDSKGKALKKDTDYTVSYASGRKNVGRYAVTITFKGNYSGTKTLYYNIAPQGTKVTKLTAKSKGFVVQWATQKNQTTGYQIQYSTSSNFSNATTVTMPKNTYYARNITGRAGGKKHYVRVRTYKTVKFNGKNYNIYSAWSDTKTITTKR